MESLNLKEENIIKGIRNLFRQKKGTKAREKENYYKLAIVSNFWSNNHIVYRSNGDRNKTLSFEQYFNKIRPYLKDVINKLKNSDSWKIQLTIAKSFISPIHNDEEYVMHSRSDNIEIMINDGADEVIKELRSF